MPVAKPRSHPLLGNREGDLGTASWARGDMTPRPSPGPSDWIVSTTLDKPDATTRRAIRRHVMRNKNTRENRQATRVKQLMQDYDAQWHSRQTHKRPGEQDDDEAKWTPLSLRQVCTELACFDLGMEMKPYMLELIHRAFTVIKPSTYIEKGLVGKQQDTILCLENLTQSPAMVHAVMYAAQSYHDSLTHKPLSRIAQHHLVETVRHLQIALRDDAAASAHMTMAVVVSLATTAAMIGDINGLLMHTEGLHRMVMLRGGLESLGAGSMLEQKAQKLDFGIALATGAKTRFFREDVPWGPSIALDQATLCPELAPLLPDPDPRLLNVWADLREFSRVANQVTRTGIKMSPGFFSLLGDTVPYRLVNLEYDPSSTAELARLCMLAYTKGLLVQSPGLGKTLVFLHTRLKAALITRSPHRPLGPFLLWALFVAALTVFEDFDRDWIREMAADVVKELAIRDWEEARAVLKGFLWADLLFDYEARRLFGAWFRPT